MSVASLFSLKALDQWLAPPLPLPSSFSAQVFKLAPRWQVSIALMLNILSLALPILMLQVYDRIIPHQAYSTLAFLLIGVLVALGLDAFLRLARAYLIGWTSASSEHAAGRAAVQRMVEADMEAFEALQVGTHMQRFNALSRLREFSSGQALMALVDLPFVAVYLLLILYIGGILVVVPVLLLLAFVLFSQEAGNWLKVALDKRHKADDRKSSYVISILTGVHTAKALAMEAPLVRRFEKRQARTTNASYKVALASGFATTLSAAFGQLSLIVTAAAGCLLVINGNLTIGGLSACTLLAGRALQPVQRVLGTWLRLQDFDLAHAHAKDLLMLPVQPRTEEALPEPRGEIALENVTFAYGEAPVLQHVSLSVARGESIAIIGDKGAGKSTLLQLIAGVLTPQHGVAWVDGHNPAQYSMTDLRAHIGYLPQKTTIFKGTILENISGFSTDDAVIEQAKAAGKKLGLDAVVDLLPKGYETMLNDSMSDPVPPGVKQRIALTRVLKNNPALLLFDDADRALDKEGYNRLFKLMGSLKGQCALVMVSHDQNLLSFADRFYALEHGVLTQVASNTVQQLSSLMQPKREEPS